MVFFEDTAWSDFDTVIQALRNVDLCVRLTPLDDDFDAFFLHSATDENINKFIFAEKPIGEDKSPKTYTAIVDELGFSLSVKTAIRDEDWDEGKVDQEAGTIHMGLQEELGLSEPNSDEVERFSRLVSSLISDLLHA